MRRFTGLCGVVLSLAAAAWCVADVDAAKGVKKGAEHKHHGVITAVHHQSKGGGGSITLHTKRHGKKKKNGTVAVAKQNHNLNLRIDSATRVELIRRGKRTVGSLAAVHQGEHVFVMSHNGHADLIEIHKHAKKRKF